MAKAAILNIEILAKAGEALEQFDKVKEKASGAHAAMKAGALVATAAVIGAFGAATKAAMDHEDQVAKLQTAYRDAGVSTKDMGSALEEIEARSRRTGQSTEDNIDAYTKLIAATHSTAKAHEELGIAEDLAAFKGVSVSDAATAVTRASEGNTKALKAMGIATTDAAGKQLPAAELMKRLEAAVHGQADAMGNTASGQMKRYQESLEQTKEKIGEALLPVLHQFLAILQPLFDWLAKNTAVVKTVVLAVGGLVLIVKTVTLAMKAWEVIQLILNAVMDANPIGLVILAVAALIAIIVLVVKHWSDVKNVVNVVWDALKQVGAWIMSHWKIIIDVLLGPLGLVITHFQDIWSAIQDVIHALEAVGRAVSDALGWLGKLEKAGGGLLGKALGAVGIHGAGGGAAVQPVSITVFATPGDDLPEVVYQALRDYQRRHVRAELRPLFG